MKNFKVKFLFSFLLTTLAVLLFFVASFSVVHADATIIIDDVSSDTTWTLAGSPYIIENDINVLSNVTLSIDPGVVVKFSGFSVNVFGVLLLNGAIDNKIYFTSNYDDLVGGDTGGDYYCFDNIDEDGNILGQTCDGSFFVPKESDWGGIFFINSEGSILKNTIFRYANETLNLDSSKVDFENIEIIDSHEGLSAYNQSHLNFSGGRIQNIWQNAIQVYDSSFAFVSNLYVDSINQNAVQVFNSSVLSLVNTNIENIFHNGISVFASSSINTSGSSLKNVLEGDGIVVYESSSFTGNTFKVENVFGDFTESILVYDDSDLSLDSSSIKVCPSAACITFYDNGSDINKKTNINIKNSNIDTGLGSGILTFGHGNTIANIHNSVIKGFVYFSIENYSETTIDAKNNWWGGESGPFNETLNSNGDILTSGAITNQVDFIPWCLSETCRVRNPVILIPGVMGTEIYDGTKKLWLNILHNLTDIGDQFMDALKFNEELMPVNSNLITGDLIKNPAQTQHFYDLIIEEFKNQGYVEGTDFFTFPYDWRFGVDGRTIENFRQKVSEVLNRAKSDKVDVIAHSTGGLLVKKYAMDYPNDNHIDKAVFVGVPNTGSPQALKALLEGANFGNIFLADSEMKKLAKNFPVVYDLLPSQKYFYDKGSFVQVVNNALFKPYRKDLDFNETIDFLINDHSLNNRALEKAKDLHQIDFDNYDLRTAGIDPYNIVGCKAGTLGKIIERRSKLLFGGKSISYDRPEMIPGDGTVPLESATNLPVDQEHKFFALKADHGKMPSQNGIRQKIVNIITGSDLSTENIITQDISKCKLKGKAIAIYSPLSIDVFDQEGNHSGFSPDGVIIENYIPNAYFEIFNDHKFVYLPNDDNQIYTINIQGTGNGTFTLTDTSINDNRSISMQVFKDIPVTSALAGKVNMGETTTLSVDNGDGNIVNISPSYVLDEEHLNDFNPILETNDPIDSQINSSGNYIKRSKPNSVVSSIEEIQNEPMSNSSKKDSGVSLVKKREFSKVKKEIPLDLIQNIPIEASVVLSKRNVSPASIIISIVGIGVLLFLVKKFIKR